MKKLTLAQTWRKCLRMWKWVAENEAGENGSERLKEMWLNRHEPRALEHNCYFCQYAAERFEERPYEWREDTVETYCRYCPARLVARRFQCEDTPHDWIHNPRAFYRKLVELNKKRKQKLTKEK